MDKRELSEELALVVSMMKVTASILINAMPRFPPCFDFGSMFFVNNH